MAAPTRAQLIAYARKVAIANGVDPDIFVRQIQQESGFSPTARNAGSGASGIAQLMPQFYPNVDASDPYASLDAAAQTMGGNLKRNGGDYSKALAAYNAGQGNVDKYGGVPPFAETQTYIKTILGNQGGKTMAPMREGVTIDPAMIDAAINGDTTPGFVPDGEVGTPGASSPAAGPTSPTNQMNGNDILQLIIDKIGPPVSTVVVNPTTKTAGGAFGPQVNPNKEPTYRYTWANGKTLDIAALDTGPVVKGGTALATLASGSAPTVKTFPDGSLRQEDPSKPLGSSARWITIAEPPANKADPAPKTIDTKAGKFQWVPGTGYSLIPGTEPPGARAQIHTMPNGDLEQYDPDTGQWTMIQPRYVDPDEAAYKKALTAEANANTQKTQRGLRPTALAAFEDANATIDAISKQYVAGTITMSEMNALVAQVHQGLSATLAGTTLFERQKQAEDTATQRANQATSLLNQRVQSAASLGSSLFSAATGHVMLPKGQATLGIDPLAIANQEINTMGGGQATGDAAAAFLKSVLGGQGAPPEAAGGPVPGQSAAGGFPTTREDVLARYPELAATPDNAAVPQTAGTPFVPPNYEATASDVPLTVLPPRPMSLTNQRIQAGG